RGAAQAGSLRTIAAGSSAQRRLELSARCAARNCACRSVEGALMGRLLCLPMASRSGRRKILMQLRPLVSSLAFSLLVLWGSAGVLAKDKDPAPAKEQAKVPAKEEPHPGQDDDLKLPPF